jgi:hypothetical protein
VRMVLLRHEGRKLGKVIQVRKGDDGDGPVVVKLEPTAELTGRVTDADGEPVSGASVQALLLPSGDFSLRLPEATTDPGGRFRVPDVPTGCNYRLLAETGLAAKRRQYAFREGEIAVKPGETTDVGDIAFKND